ncbi:hypothetical protein [Nonomuraea sp. B5E05]|uniref:hypothetical protein n=1 Tax=Nonomuraea sp. B5E05 TaxID=3153569 RepID=UPI0032607733
MWTWAWSPDALAPAQEVGDGEQDGGRLGGGVHVLMLVELRGECAQTFREVRLRHGEGSGDPACLLG